MDLLIFFVLMRQLTGIFLRFLTDLNLMILINNVNNCSLQPDFECNASQHAVNKIIIFQFHFFNKFAKMSTFGLFCQDGVLSGH